MALQLTLGQLQGQAKVLDGYADTISGHATQFTTSITEMANHMAGTTANAYQSVNSSTLTPQLQQFEQALRDYASTLLASGGKLDAAEGENTARINSLISSAQGIESKLADGSWTTSNINF
jgi:uncharacterized protein YukE